MYVGSGFFLICFLFRCNGFDRPNKTVSDPHRGSIKHSNVAVMTTSPTRLIEVCRTWRHKQPLGKGPVLHCVHSNPLHCTELSSALNLVSNTVTQCTPILISILALHNFRLKLCSVKCIVQWNRENKETVHDS